MTIKDPDGFAQPAIGVETPEEPSVIPSYTEAVAMRKRAEDARKAAMRRVAMKFQTAIAVAIRVTAEDETQSLDEPILVGEVTISENVQGIELSAAIVELLRPSDQRAPLGWKVANLELTGELETAPPQYMWRLTIVRDTPVAREAGASGRSVTGGQPWDEYAEIGGKGGGGW